MLGAALCCAALTCAALRCCNVQLPQEEPGSASTWSNLGNVHMQQGLVELAVADYSEAIRLAPDAPVPFLNRAIAEEELGVRALLAVEEQQQQRNQSGDEGQPGGAYQQLAAARASARNEWALALQDCDAAIQVGAEQIISRI